MADQAPAGQGSHVRIQLTTRHSDIELPEDTGPILVSTNLRRYALSTLVNTLLQSERPIPFEFLINGQFLRTTIDGFLTANGISAETTLTVEYIRALIPPLHIASFEHDDWVSSVDVLSGTAPASAWASEAIPAGQARILSGSFDGLLRVWSMSSEVVAMSASAMEGGHTAPIKAAKWLSPTKIVSSGNDRTVRIWSYSESGGDTATPAATMTPSIELYGHKSSVDTIAVHAPSSRILSGSADHTLGLWSTRKSDAPPAPTSLLPTASASFNKRRKLNKTPSTKQTPQRGPLALLTGHTNPVSGTIFAPNDPTVAYSVSWDQTLRTWDLPTQTCVDTRTTSHPLLSLTAMNGVNLLAAGTSARHITMVDPRASATTIAAMTLRGHTNAVVSLAADPDGAYGLVSGSHDGTCRIWDVRSVRPGVAGTEGQVGESVYVIQRESVRDTNARRVAGDGVKVFGVCWNRDVGIVSGSEDRRVQINRGQGVVSQENR